MERTATNDSEFMAALDREDCGARLAQALVAMASVGDTWQMPLPVQKAINNAWRYAGCRAVRSREIVASALRCAIFGLEFPQGSEVQDKILADVLGTSR